MASTEPFLLLTYTLLLAFALAQASIVKLPSTIILNSDDAPGYLHSPNYPSDYPSKVDQEWTIIVPPGRRIRVHLIEFVLERFHDFLQFYEGDSNETQSKTPFAEITGRCTASNPDECLDDDTHGK